MRMSTARSTLALLFGGILAAVLIVRLYGVLFSPNAQPSSDLRYEIVDDRGVAEDSLFDSKNPKIPLKVLAKAIEVAKTPPKIVPCSSAKPSPLSKLITPFTAFAQECSSPCVGSYNRTCNVGGECEGLFLCCYDEHNEDWGCMGKLYSCENGGQQCGQVECPN